MIKTAGAKILLKIAAVSFMAAIVLSGAMSSIAVDDHSTNNTSNHFGDKFTFENIAATDTPFTLSSNTIYVPDDYEKIQWAVDNATEGDTIIVRDGTYIENVDVNKPHLTIRSENGSENCIVQAAKPGYHVFEVTADYVNISGFTVIETGWWGKAGVCLDSADYCTLSNNNVSNNEGGEGFYLMDSNYNNITKNNISNNGYAGIYLEDSVNNNITNNNLLNNGLFIYFSYQNTVKNNTVNDKPLIYLEEESDYTIIDAGHVILVNCNNVTVNNLDLSNATVGVELWGTNNSRITNNNALNNDYGIYLNDSSNNNITSNIVSGTWMSILLDYSSNNILMNNIASNTGITLGWSDNNTLLNNTANSVIYYGFSSNNSINNKANSNLYDNTDLDYSSKRNVKVGKHNPSPPPNFGISLYSSNNNRIYGNNATNWYEGIYLEDSSDNTIANNNASNNHDYGIHLYYSSNNNITSSITLNNDYGIYLEDSSNNTIANNNASKNDYYGVYLEYYSSNNTITNNNASNNGGGISLSGSNNNITNNVANSNRGSGISLFSASNDTLTNNTMSGNEYNFAVYGWTLSDFIQNIDTSNKVDGKPIYYWVNEKDKPVPSDAGFVGIVNSTNITVRDLILTNNSEGVLFAYSKDSRIENVTVSNCTYGIHLHSSSNNTLFYNNVNSNNRYGIGLMYLSNGSKIYLNNFINNTDNVYSYRSTNIWNSTLPLSYSYNGTTYTSYLGNYWDDYSDTDANGDGIWDNPYSIDGDKDYYPLMEGFENYTIPYPDWSIYTPLNSGLPNYPKSIAIDDTGNAWIGTFNGLVKFDGTNWTIYHVSNPRFPDGCSHCDWVSQIAIDSDGSIWSAVGYITAVYGSFSWYSRALAKFDGLNWTIFDPENSGLPGMVNSIIIDASGNKWIGTHGFGLAKFDNTNWVIFNTSNSDLHTNYLTSGLAIDSAGNLWIGTQYGVAKFDGVNYWERYDPPQNLGFYPGSVTSIAIDQNDDKWVGTASGLAKFDGNAWTVYDSTNVLPGDWVTSIAIDANDNKWIGITPSNNIWHGWTGGGLVKFDGSTWTVFTQANSGLPDDSVLAVTAAKNNEIWVGTNTALAIYKQVTSTNKPPNPPTHLKQLKSDSETKIPVGNTTDERIVVFKGMVSDPDGDRVRLQVELRNLNESGGQFNETKGDFKTSDLVGNGRVAVTFAEELVDERYHWRARTVDEHGNKSAWVPFGNNSILDADFVVNQSVGQGDKENLIKSIEDLRKAMLFKIDWDVSRTADTFTHVRGYQLTKKWADIFGFPLNILETIIQICSIPKKIDDFYMNPNSEWIKFKSSLEVVSFGLMFQGLEKSAHGFSIGIFGPPYATAVKDMIKSADAAYSPIELFFNFESYQTHIKNDLVIAESYAKSPLQIPRKSGDISRNTIGSSNGALDAKRSINKEFYTLIDDIRSNDLPADFQTDKVISELNALRGEIYKSCNQNVDVEYNTYLVDEGNYLPKHVNITMGTPAKYNELFVELCNNLAKKLSVEIEVEAINALEATTVIVAYKFPDPLLEKVIDVPLTILSVDGIRSELDLLTLYSTVEDEFYMLPQEMLMSVQLESSNLWMVADDINRYLRYEIGILETTMHGVDEIYAHFGSPGELRVYDSQSRVTGLVNGEVVEEIPYSDYYQSTVSILFPTDSYCYEIAGTENGTYTLDITSITNSTKSYFFVANIPIQDDWKHQYPINWTNFSQGKEVFIVRKDENGDGAFEENVTIIPPVANFSHVPEGPVTFQSIIFNASSSSDSDGFIRNYLWNFGDGNSGEGLVTTHFYSLPGDYNVILVVTDNDGALTFMGRTITINPSFFDTYSRANPYPSIAGTHNGTITPSCNLTVNKLYTYPCPGTGGHTEYARIWNNFGLDVNASWNGYVGDWHNINFNDTFTLYANETYNYTIKTGSYPQIIHETPFNATGGVITCTKFTDANGRTYNNWIPAIRLWAE